MKALTYEEWSDAYRYSDASRRKLFDLARQGMIEESFIGFKQKEDWPNGARGFVTYFTDKPKMEAAKSWAGNPIGAFTYVRRDDEPAWTPKVGEAVFFIYRGMVLPGIVKNILEPFNGISHGIDIIHEGTIYGVMTHEVKPFDAPKIGKPWEEI